MGVSELQWFRGKQNPGLHVCAKRHQVEAQGSHRPGLKHCSPSRRRSWTSSQGGSSVKVSGLLFEELRLQPVNGSGHRRAQCLTGSGRSCTVFSPGLPVTWINPQRQDSYHQIPTRSTGIFAKDNQMQPPSNGWVRNAKHPYS